MRPDLVVLRVSSVGVALLVISLAAGAGLSVLLNNGTPLVVLGLVGLYLLFAIRKADQWEKVAVLRFGKYIGLRGPGMFHVIPVVIKQTHPFQYCAEPIRHHQEQQALKTGSGALHRVSKASTLLQPEIS